MKKILIPIILIMVELAHGADFWTSLSVRSPYTQPNPFDFEIKVGGESRHNNWMYGVERENGKIYKMSDMQYLYENFRFKWERKEARNVDFTEALWSTTFDRLKGFSYGGSLRNDMIVNMTKYLAYAKYKRYNITAEAYHNAMDYYSYSIKYEGRLFRGFYPLIIYKNVNREIWYQAKMVYRFKIGG